MREIKFRAWSRKHKKWLNREESFLNLFSVQSGLYQILDLEIQQFTGLKDKNGKEIYEGDILLCCDNSPDFYSEVKYLAPMWSAKSPNGNNVFFWNDHFSKFEVAGNIFENSELLK